MSRLFKPLSVGPAALQHRVAMAPLTRYRWGDDWDSTGMKEMIIGMSQHTKTMIDARVDNRSLINCNRVLRTESMCSRYTDCQRSDGDCQECRGSSQLSWNLVRNPDRLMEGDHHSSAQERLCYLLSAVASRSIGRCRGAGIRRLQDAVCQCRTNDSPRSGTGCHD